jgi:CxxC motif-containing protein (DUF1111 family)
LTTIAAATTLISGCGSGDFDAGRDIGASEELAVGDKLSGISDADFAAAKAAFVTVEGIDDGRGPIFNEAACGNCHSEGATGGAGVQIERRFGRFDNGQFNPLANEGGSLRQLFANEAFTNDAERACPAVTVEHEPADATVHNVGRVTTPLFGAGLVDTISDGTLQLIATTEIGTTNGRVNMVNIVLPDPHDSNQSIGSRRAGRFGWKAGVPNLVQFAADAYVNEMGITTDHCFKGTKVTAFATESAPNGVPVDPACEDGVPGVDDSVGACASGQTTIQDDVAEFTEFMTFLAPPPRVSGSTATGQILFTSTGCAGCHTPFTFHTPSNPPNGVPANMAFNPFSDFLTHDMGALGDRIGNPGDSEATTRRMRTAPLWGVRFRSHLLHDGRASNIRDAILAHAGQGQNAADSFRNLSSSNQTTLVNYVNSL